MKPYRVSLLTMIAAWIIASGTAHAIGIHAGGFHGGGGFGGGGFGGAGNAMAGMGRYGMGARPMPMGGMRGYSPQFGAGGFRPGGMPGRGPQSYGTAMRPSIPAFAGNRIPNDRPSMQGYRGAGRAPTAPVRPATHPQGRLNPADINQFLGIPGQGREMRPGGTPAANPFVSGHAGNRASWQHISPDAAAQVHDRIHGAVRPGSDRGSVRNDWLAQHPERAQQIQDRGDRVRQRWNGQSHPDANNAIRNRFDNRGVIPGSDWWSKYHPDLDKWYYHHRWHDHDWHYWWGYTAWPAVVPWFGDWGWTEPVYYDYGSGGNIVMNDDSVTVNGQNVGTPQEYAQSAADLATVPASADASPDSASTDDSDWLPLGTFAVVTSDHNTDPSRILQLAVNKQGIISGTLNNASTDKSYVVQGRVDKKTQRVAMTIGDKADVVLETGLYNLTQPQTSVLVHYGDDRSENYLLVRLEAK